MNIAVGPGPERAALPCVFGRLPQAGEDILGRIGGLSVRLARTADEVRAARELRRRVFFADAPDMLMPLDEERYDLYCDHLLVFDETDGPAGRSSVVGTYRLLRQDRARQAGGFCTQGEFDAEGLVLRWPERSFLELGRSCVLPQHRSKRTAELLWQGIWAYCRRHAIDVLFGCASFPGTAMARHALPLSFLFHHVRADAEWQAEPTSKLAAPMDLVPAEAVNPKSALAAMPPLIKAYLRLGAKFGDSAVIDPVFGTTDVLVILRTEDISGRYLAHFSAESGRFT